MLKFLQRHFLTGLLSITPLAITVWILWHFYKLVSESLKPWVERLPGMGETYPGFVLTLIGMVGVLLAITLVGLFTRNLIGMAFFRLVERFFVRIPVVKSVFSATKQIAEVFLKDRRTAFKKVVLFEYPRQGLLSIGFVTRDEPGEDLLNVFLPTAPNPTSGYMLLVPREDTRELGIPVEEAIKLIVSGGAIMTETQAANIGQLGMRLAHTTDPDVPRVTEAFPEAGEETAHE
ncbi:hypothetical protein CSA17_00765 [bacterium DOLJORAL78_65_58]|nr:MAG: hypothetical protein CSB20_02120 [bacterium DOLZORAL124_64_63]PIE76704.1 MAG: hypothetical protein CSA17_00765 [bacterium DOLJORAL78_65_58]